MHLYDDRLYICIVSLRLCCNGCGCCCQGHDSIVECVYNSETSMVEVRNSYNLPEEKSNEVSQQVSRKQGIFIALFYPLALQDHGVL